jgi:purine-binding chemotaxis protein CheW
MLGRVPRWKAVRRGAATQLLIICRIRTCKSEKGERDMSESTKDIKGASQGKSEELIQLVSFTIGDEEFGVDILKVQEINRMLAVTRVPNSPEYIDGVINLRGKVIPIIDLRRRFRMERKEHDKNTRIVVVELSGKVVGFVVDAVSEVLRIPKSVTEPPPPIVAGVDAEYITAVGKLEDRLLILLDLEKVLVTDEREALAAA